MRIFLSRHTHFYFSISSFRFFYVPLVVTLLDYGAGNVSSIRNALPHLGFSIKDVKTPGDILNADRLIFPGVGAFAPAMDVLNKTGMGEALCTYIENDRPFLGICLGLQLLFHSSEENGPGFALLPPSPSTQSAL
uniref:Glutamine amidotransferase domain-containing protein n=1 Tax=Brassica campestris TaxID=3711 RepID=A0A3P5ZI86_BRACM|nr:unnamed protein product [Brassica rapa]